MSLYDAVQVSRQIFLMESFPDNAHSACNQEKKKSMLSMISVNGNIRGLIS